MESIKRTIGQVCAVIFGYIIFKEKINIQKVIGVFVLSIGIFYIF
jgi:multidrug transporter EmrE-like cation transporter